MCDDCDWLFYIDLSEEMLLDEKYEFAEKTVSGIKKWVDKANHITDKQKEALDNIYNSVEL